MDCFGLTSGLGYLSKENLHPPATTLTVYLPDCAHTHTHTHSDPPQHTRNPPVTWHDNLTDDPSSLVVVWPWVEATQGLVVAAAIAVTTATVLAAVAVVIQAVIQLDSSISLQRRAGVGRG